MIVIFDNCPVLAKCMRCFFGKKRKTWIFPNDQIPSLDSAVKWLEQNSNKRTMILVNANVSLQRPRDVARFEGLRLLRDIFLKRISYAQVILYGLDSVKTLRKYGGKVLLDMAGKMYQYLKLPNAEGIDCTMGNQVSSRTRRVG